MPGPTELLILLAIVALLFGTKNYAAWVVIWEVQ